MKHIFSVFAFFLASAIVFAAFAFTLWDTDPSRWSLTSRGLYCCLSILVGGFAVAACEEFHT